MSTKKTQTGWTNTKNATATGRVYNTNITPLAGKMAARSQEVRPVGAWVLPGHPCNHDAVVSVIYVNYNGWVLSSDGVKARAPEAKTKAIGIKAKAVVHKAKAKAYKDKVINRDQGLCQGHDEPTQYHFLRRKYLPVTMCVLIIIL